MGIICGVARSQSAVGRECMNVACVSECVVENVSVCLNMYVSKCIVY